MSPPVDHLPMPSLGGATGWINSAPLDLAELREAGHSRLVAHHNARFPNVTAAEQPLEASFRVSRGFTARPDRVRQAVKVRAIDYPVALDNDYGIWRAFDNHYWPALYFIDADGIIRDRHFGEGRYGESERVIQRLLGVERGLVSAEGLGVEAEADWEHLRTPETYLGYGRGENFASPGHVAFDERRRYEIPDRVSLGHWALAGDWTVGRERVVLDRAGGSIVYRFHARDAHLVLAPASTSAAGEPIPFRVLLDGLAPGPSAGEDIDEDGNGTLRDGRLYQLVRERGAVRERALQITFGLPGVGAYVFTFG